MRRRYRMSACFTFGNGTRREGVLSTYLLLDISET